MPLHHVPTIAVDAAVIKPPEGLECAAGGVRGIRDLWPGDDKPDIPVRKHGAQTGATTGLLKPVGADLRVRDQRARYSMGWWVYAADGVFAERGDSGAIVLDEERNAVGMLVAVEHDGTQAGDAFVHGIQQIFRALCIALP